MSTFNGGPLNGREIELDERAIGVTLEGYDGHYQRDGGDLYWHTGPAATPLSAQTPSSDEGQQHEPARPEGDDTVTSFGASVPAELDVEHVRPAPAPAVTRTPTARTRTRTRRG